MAGHLIVNKSTYEAISAKPQIRLGTRAISSKSLLSQPGFDRSIDRFSPLQM